MMGVRGYVLLYLDKKKISRTELVKKINRVEELLGDARTKPMNVTNYLNGYHSFGRRCLAKWEVALDLEEGSLYRMVAPPLSSEGEKEFNEYIKKLREIRRML